ncbi:cation transporter [Aliikangiella marina]|uniref:Cation transporter n=1 Tax=Aliikangiella marina TaxID=1712262 RepID=A0A545TJC0_9GAMM|nr:cation transporter [Aliikangiella marina]TQV77329.1 cation transporter [Aliikangiella marina]
MSDNYSGSCQSCSGNEIGEQPSSEGFFDKPYSSLFKVPKMDCPSEERIIRLALDSVEPEVGLSFDIPSRELRVFHDVNLDEIEQKLTALGFGATLQSTKESCPKEIESARDLERINQSKESATLKWLLVINAFMFFTELSVGWIAQSTGLIADSLDMFADAAVYGLALYAVGHSIKMKLKAAQLSGWLQVILALGALSEVVRRFTYGSEPISELMMAFGLVALLANSACLMLIHKQKDSGVHMKASWIFSANDVIANLGVILAGMLVMLTGSRFPDLVIGLIIGIVVLYGAGRILRLKA